MFLKDKKALRKELMEKRRSLDKNDRLISDKMIYTNLMICPEIINADVILTYISTEIEVGTIKLIEAMLKNGKTVAVPKCEGKKMRFIRIESLNSLVKGAFGIPEPTGNDEITDFKGAVCITPALSFDNNGYRLGYGGGFYDRFFERFNGISVGICYDDFIGEVPREEYDRCVDILVTESAVRYIRK